MEATIMSGIEDEIRKLALQNAVQFKGAANPKAIVGKILGTHPECRSDVPGTTELINKIVGDVNAMSPEAQKAELDAIDPSLAKKEKKVRTYELPDLKNVEQGRTVMRIAPGPSGPLHIGHTRVYSSLRTDTLVWPMWRGPEGPGSILMTCFPCSTFFRSGSA